MPDAVDTKQPLFELDDLRIGFPTDGGIRPVVDGVSLRVSPGEVLGIVGESGSGKTISMLASMRLMGRGLGAVVEGSARYQGEDLLAVDESRVRELRGTEIGFVFQDPMTSLNPVYKIGWQITEQIRAHTEASKADARDKAAELLAAVGIPDPLKRMDAYPHEFSGGMRQRAMIAMALSCDPKLLIADEPTTALDVTVQAQILDLIARLREELDLSVVMITHNFGVVAGIADRVTVMRHGKVVEEADTRTLFYSPRQDYTKALLAAVPRLDTGAQRRFNTLAPTAGDAPTGTAAEGSTGTAPTKKIGEVLMRAENVSKHFDVGARRFLSGRSRSSLRAVDGVTLEVREGETLSLVGESGSGKSTLARCLIRLHDVTDGTVCFEGRDITDLGGGEMRGVRGEMQMIFQDPLASLNPRHRVSEIVAAPMRIHRMGSDAQIFRRVNVLLERVGLGEEYAGRFPRELSGGQRQRVSIARALSVEPKLIIADEAVSALDVSIQAEVLNLFMDLQDELGIAYVFISHDLSVVRHFSDRVAVMYHGEIVEQGPVEAIYDAPTHPYTKKLLASVPTPDPDIMRAQRTRSLEERAAAEPAKEAS